MFQGSETLLVLETSWSHFPCFHGDGDHLLSTHTLASDLFYGVWNRDFWSQHLTTGQRISLPPVDSCPWMQSESYNPPMCVYIFFLPRFSPVIPLKQPTAGPMLPEKGLILEFLPFSGWKNLEEEKDTCLWEVIMCHACNACFDKYPFIYCKKQLSEGVSELISLRPEEPGFK